MTKVLAFAGSNSSTSINHKLVEFAASQINSHDVKIIKLTDFPLELFSEDIEKERGFSDNLKGLLNEIENADALIVSVNEHNSATSAYFKNVLDWLSRIKYKFLEDKKILLMSTSPGRGGAAKSLEYVKDVMTNRYNGTVVESFSFPSFNENFSKTENKITNETLAMGFTDILQNFEHQINT
ncbi:MAG: NAD(P)H-dependent oxidoreductase [Flavobacteriaceae bacterium]|nr:NAD(P)H-dependent oxidoreductase [Flavobacteriaceae bacterium]